MKAIRLSFMQMLACIWRDMMLAAACATPLLIGLVFRLGIPALEAALTARLGAGELIAPYYRLVDIFYSMIAPVMFCFVTAMTTLEEKDNGIAAYLFVTPLGRTGYLVSRFGIPTLVAFVVTLGLMPIFSLSGLGIGDIVFLAASGALQGLLVALIIITASSNKLEGMALAKLSTIIMLGAVLPYFLSGGIVYAFSLLPSLWIGLAMREGKAEYMPVAIVLSLVWIFALIKRYLRKIK